MIVAIDGASTELSLALADRDGDMIDEMRWTSVQRQSAELLPRLLTLLGTHRRALDEISAFAIGTGPGSFTGLRVAMALGKGLAYGLGRPIVGVPSLEAWLDAEPGAAAAMTRAGARDAYLLVRDDPAPTIADHDALPSAIEALTVVAPAELASTLRLPDARPPRGAAAMALRAAARLEHEPGGDDLGRLEPIYLRAPRGVTGTTTGAVRWL